MAAEQVDLLEAKIVKRVIQSGNAIPARFRRTAASSLPELHAGRHQGLRAGRWKLLSEAPAGITHREERRRVNFRVVGLADSLGQQVCLCAVRRR